jgi:hypothetical protein
MPDREQILGELRDAGGMLMVHAEDNDMIEAKVPRLIHQNQNQSRLAVFDPYP